MVSLVGMRCRTAERTLAGARGVDLLAPLVGKRLGREPRMIGTPGEPRESGYEDDLRDSRGCLLEAGGQVDDALTGGRVPVLVAGSCSVSLTTLPAVVGHEPEAKVLWFDADGDYHTPQTTPDGFLGGMSLAGACGEWDAGLGATIPPARVVLAGVRELDEGERALLERSEAAVIGASTVETLVAAKNALDGAPVYVHMGFGAVELEGFPEGSPPPGSIGPERAYDLMEAVAEDSRIVGVEVTGFEPPEDEETQQTLAAIALRVLEPVLDRLPADPSE